MIQIGYRARDRDTPFSVLIPSIFVLVDEVYYYIQHFAVAYHKIPNFFWAFIPYVAH